MQNVCKFSSLSFLDKAAVSGPYRALLFLLLPACFQLLWAHPTLYSTGLWLPPPSLPYRPKHHSMPGGAIGKTAAFQKPRAHSVGSPPSQPHTSQAGFLIQSSFPGTKAGGLSNKRIMMKRDRGQIAVSPQSCRWKRWAHDLLTKERRAMDLGDGIMSANRSCMKRKGAAAMTLFVETEISFTWRKKRFLRLEEGGDRDRKAWDAVRGMKFCMKNMSSKRSSRNFSEVVCKLHFFHLEESPVKF